MIANINGLFEVKTLNTFDSSTLYTMLEIQSLRRIVIIIISLEKISLKTHFGIMGKTETVEKCRKLRIETNQSFLRGSKQLALSWYGLFENKIALPCSQVMS